MVRISMEKRDLNHIEAAVGRALKPATAFIKPITRYPL